MKFNFLSADKPIVKKYELDLATNTIIKHPYPFIYEVTSHEENVTDLLGLTQAMVKHAKLGNCMVKGELGRTLVSESRRGTTSPDAPTEWICLDLDGINNYQTVDAFLADIGAANVDYILQWSSSMGIENNGGYRCHIFMLLDKPTRPQVLKNWLMHLNLTIPTIAAQLELTKTANALRWPLDVTTCQSDKLLYIAPPDLQKGIVDPYPKNTRITLEQRSKRALSLPGYQILPDVLKDKSQLKIEELRKAQNLPKIKTQKFKHYGDVEYLSNPGTATITDIKEERGFVYFNLNGGDSWAYYHPADNPDFIYNFKGEPAYRTQDLLPAYWAKLSQSAASGAPNAKGEIFLAFREFTTGIYWNGIYDTNRDVLQLYQAKSETQLRHFMQNHSMPMGETVPDWSRVFEPSNPDVIDRVKQTVNVYNPSEYFKDLSPPVVTACPPICLKIIENMLGNDAQTVDHFMNWFAVAVQTRFRVGTAWVLQGTQGTGKGLFMHKIVSPLFGHENVVSKRMEEIESEFTGFMENKFIVFIDEIETGKSLYHAKITAKLKNLIVEPQISIRNMYRQAYMAPNFASMIFASNKDAAVEVPPDDRRFNVGVYQTSSLKITQKEIDDIEAELPDLYAYLMNYPADAARARTPLNSAARNNLIEISRTAVDTIADAILKGSLEVLWDHLPSTKQSSGNALLHLKAQAYRDLILDLVTNQPATLTRDELFTIFEYTVGNMPTSPNKLTSLLKHHRIMMTTIYKNGRSVRGIHVNWNTDPKWLANAHAEIGAGAI